MLESLESFISRYRPDIEKSLLENAPRNDHPGAAVLNEAIHYILFPGGKRWRPILTLLGAHAVGACATDALEAAAAIEFLHTSSLILDDLPAMDDASIRRGQSALHVVYGEHVAILAALSLLNEAYRLFSKNAERMGGARLIEEIMQEAKHCIGPKGMIGGQAIDLSYHAIFKNNDLETLICRDMKTAALLQLTLSAGAIVCGAAERDISLLKRYGRALGFAYQICDDVLDEICASEQTGKPARQDSRHFRISILDHVDADAAFRLAQDLTETEKRNLRRQLGDRPAVQLLLDAAAVILQDSKRLAKKIA